jgi:hypothetical protein
MPETIYQKLAKVKSSLKIKKELRNDYAGFNYASLDSILEAVNLKLDELNLSFNITEYSDNGDQSYTVKAILIDAESDKTIDFSYTLHGAVITTKAKGETMDTFVYKIQDAGSAITYITRYVYGLVFSIPFEDDNIQKNTGNPDVKPAVHTNQITWLTKDQFDKALNSTPDQIDLVLKKYTTDTHKMSKAFRTQLEAKLQQNSELPDPDKIVTAVIPNRVSYEEFIK